MCTLRQYPNGFDQTKILLANKMQICTMYMRLFLYLFMPNTERQTHTRKKKLITDNRILYGFRDTERIFKEANEQPTIVV